MYKIYLYLLITISIHEFIHYIIIKYSKIDIYKIKIGNLLFFRISKLYISPILFSGSVEYSKEQFEMKSLRNQLLIIVTPSLINILLGVILWKFNIIFSIISILSGLFAIFPFMLIDNDGKDAILAIYAYYNDRKYK